MANITVGGRAYITSENEFAYKQRGMLGVKSSALVLSDLGTRKGYIGILAKELIVDPVTKKNELDVVINVPTDFREVGLSVMNGMGIPIETQTTMFNNFITNYTKEQRTSFVDMYDAVDKNDANAVQAFVDQMLAMLT